MALRLHRRDKDSCKKTCITTYEQPLVSWFVMLSKGLGRPGDMNDLVSFAIVQHLSSLNETRPSFSCTFGLSVTVYLVCV